MRSVADDLRRESILALAALTPLERIALALRLGDEDVARYAAVQGTPEDEARAAFRRAREAGRVSSPSNAFERQ
jgi:hypothetical protein